LRSRLRREADARRREESQLRSDESEKPAVRELRAGRTGTRLLLSAFEGETVGRPVAKSHSRTGRTPLGAHCCTLRSLAVIRTVRALSLHWTPTFCREPAAGVEVFFGELSPSEESEMTAYHG
jgi:hypothetical protein